MKKHTAEPTINEHKVTRHRKGKPKTSPVVETITLSRLDDNFAYNKAMPISLKISASTDDWKDFYYYLTSGEPTKLNNSCFPELIKEVECICIENRIIGPHAGDNRKSKINDELKRFVATVYVFVEHWKEESPDNWPEEYKELLRTAKGSRCGLRTIVFKYCLAKEKLSNSNKQKSFEYQFIDRERPYLKMVQNIAKQFVIHNNGAFPSLKDLSDQIEDRSMLSFTE